MMGLRQPKIGIGRWRAGLKEVGILLAIYGVYFLTRGNLPDREVAAFLNGLQIVDWEKRLGIFVEPDFQSLFLKNAVFMKLLNWIYSYYLPVVIIFGFWLYHRSRERYVLVRNVLIVSAAIGFIVFALYPVAPPRMIPGFGFTDTLSTHGGLRYDLPGYGDMVNPYAAMPSFHFAWTLLVGIGTVYMARAWWLKVLGGLFPLGSLVAIVATGNHFVLDAIAGGLLIGLSYAIVVLFTRLKGRRANGIRVASAPERRA